MPFFGQEKRKGGDAYVQLNDLPTVVKRRENNRKGFGKTIAKRCNFRAG